MGWVWAEELGDGSLVLVNGIYFYTLILWALRGEETRKRFPGSSLVYHVVRGQEAFQHEHTGECFCSSQSYAMPPMNTRFSTRLQLGAAR